MSRYTKNAFKPLLITRTLSFAIATLLLSNLAHAFDSGSTGADGVFSPTVNTVVQLPPSGVLNYTSVNIPQGVTVTFKKNALNTPVYMLVSGDATIEGTLSVSATKAADTGTAGDGNLADDGNPGLGGPGGYDGGRGGKPDVNLRPKITSGASGLGPGGGYPGTGRVTQSHYCNDPAAARNIEGFKASHSGNGPSAPAAVACEGKEPDGFISNPALPIVPAYGSPVLQPLVGGSGGGGGAGGTNFAGAGGGGGGGALLLAVSGVLDLKYSGKVSANSTPGANISGVNVGGYGGAGSGGAIRIIATNFKGQGQNQIEACVTSSGGTCDNDSDLRSAHGRIRVEADNITYTGYSVPTYVADTPAPVFLSNVPSLKFVSIGGANVPANPTGKGDVSFPATLVNPVTIQLATSNVPPGNTITVKLVPSNSLPTEVVSPAITGTTASGSASVQLTLPQGASTLQAMTTYTVVVAMGEALSQFANNERVEKVQIVANMGKTSQDKAKLITISGKEFEIPVAVLQMVAATYQNTKAL